MSNNHKKNFNRKPHQDNKPRFEAIPFMAEVHIPPEEDFVKVPVAEFMGLVANNAMLDAVKRYIAGDPYNNHAVLRIMLGVTKEKEEK